MKVQLYPYSHTQSPINFCARKKQNDCLLSKSEAAELVFVGYKIKDEKEKQAALSLALSKFEEQKLTPEQIDKLARRCQAWKKVRINPGNWKEVLELPDKMFTKEAIETFQQRMAKFPDKDWKFDTCFDLYKLDEQYMDYYLEHSKSRFKSPDGAIRYASKMKETDETLSRMPESEFKKDLIKANEHIRKHFFTDDVGSNFNPQILRNIALQNDKIRDSFVKQEIKAKLEKFQTCKFTPWGKIGSWGLGDPLRNTELQEIIILQDIVNQSNGVYTTINRGYPIRIFPEGHKDVLDDKFDYQKTMEKLAKIREKEINKLAEKNETQKTDFKTEKQKISKRMMPIGDSSFATEMQRLRETQSLQDYVTLFGGKNKKMCKHLYQKYFLKDFPQDTRDQCMNIAEDFNTYVFFQKYDAAIPDLKFIHEELSKWQKAAKKSKDKAVLPCYIKFSPVYESCLRKKAGAVEVCQKNIYIKNKNNLKYALRHEVMHLNDRRPNNYNTDARLKKIDQFDEKLFKQKKWYRKELENALPNSSRKRINYAYKNSKEFLARAAEGDTSKYSKEFKEILAQLGMPEFVFNLDE